MNKMHHTDFVKDYPLKQIIDFCATSYKQLEICRCAIIKN